MKQSIVQDIHDHLQDLGKITLRTVIVLYFIVR